MMNQTENFTLRISPLERKMLTELAKRFQRSQSDTVRVLIRETLTALAKENENQTQDTPQKIGA